MTEQEDGYVALTEYIKTQLEMGTSISKASSQIKLAMKLNIIPSDAMSAVLSQPFEELYSKIKAIASEKDYPILATDTAEKYCKDLYNSLKK